MRKHLFNCSSLPLLLLIMSASLVYVHCQSSELVARENPLSVANPEAALPVANQEATLPVENQEAALPVENQEETLPVENQEAALPVENQEEALPVEGQENALPGENREESLLSETEEELEEEEEEENTVLGIILYISFGVLVGIMTKFALSWIPVPYTGWLMIWGLIIGIVEYQGGADWKHMSEGIQIMMSMSPELFLLIFLPPIILASGISMDWHILRRNMGQVLLLATVGVVIGAGLIAVVFKYVFDYGWAWDEALTVGSMMAATDPVAVVALLKEVGASKRLGIVIEGESLFNDGTAQVFFLLFREMIVGKERTLGSAIGFFCQLSIGGPAIGVGVGLAVYIFLTFVYNDFSIEISITLISAYLCYFLSEEIGGASGILAVVTLGIFMSALGKFAITPKVKEPLAIFWEMLEYLFNTVLFIYAGTVIGEVLYGVQGTTSAVAEGQSGAALDDTQFSRDVISGKDWGYACMLYVFLQVIRAITIGMLYPFLCRMGYGLTWKDGVVMTWGGLRGAVGLALALQLYLDPAIDNVFGTQVLFHMGLMAVMTLLINGTTTPFLLSMLGVTAASPEKLETLVSIIQEMENYADTHLDHLRHDAMMGDPDWDLVLKSSEVPVENVLPGSQQIKVAFKDRPNQGYNQLMSQQSSNGSGLIQNFKNKFGLGKDKDTLSTLQGALGQSMHRLPSQKDLLEVTPMLLLTAARTRYIMVVKATYAEGYEKGYIGVDEVTDLLESADRTLDKIETEMDDWSIVEQFTAVHWFKRMFLKIFRQMRLQRLTKMMLYWDLQRCAVLASAFVFAHREAQKVFDEYIQFQVSREDVDKDLCEVKLQQYEKLCHESNKQIQEAVKFLKQLKLAYPEVMRAIKTRQVAQTILRHKDKFVEEIFHSGSIEEKEAHKLESLVERKMKKLLYSPPNINVPAPVDLLREHFLFNEIAHESFYRDILPRAEMQVIDENKTVFKEGESADFLYIVVQGVVRVEHANHPAIITETIGALVGISAIVLQRPRQRSMFTETPIVAYKISSKDFRHMMGQYHTVFLRAWQTVAAALAMLHGHQQQRLMHYTELLDVYRKGRLTICEPHDWVKVANEALLMQGSLKASDGEVVNATAFVQDGPKELQALQHSMVLMLPDTNSHDNNAGGSGTRHGSRSMSGVLSDLVLGGGRRGSYMDTRISRASSQTPTQHPLVQRYRSITPTNIPVQQYSGNIQDVYNGDLQRLSGHNPNPKPRKLSASVYFPTPGRTEIRPASGPLPQLMPQPSLPKDDDEVKVSLPQIKEMGSFKFQNKN